MSYFDAIDTGQAPRLAAGWTAILNLLADDQWHPRDELIQAAVDTGLAEPTARNLVDAARHTPRRVKATGHHGAARMFRQLGGDT